MTKYDGLDPRKELEQVITQDLARALCKREFQVQHNGTRDSNAAGDRPDIVVYDDDTLINVEVTQTTKSSADREFLSIKDHLEKSKRANNRKRCFTLYVSPQTHYRMINAIRDFDVMNENIEDLKIMPICFSTFELFIAKLTQTHKERYTKGQIVALFKEYRQFVDDERILAIIHDNLFSDDDALKREVEIKEENKHQKTVENLIRDLLKLEDDLRDNKGITHINAIRNIIYLVFTKLYEEKREFERKENRFKLESFRKYQEYVNQERGKKAIYALFSSIKADPELKEAKVFTETDILADNLDDDFVMEFFIEPFEKYHFYTTKVDGLGAAYEVLGMRTGKDVKAGQFFTPENIVQFMVKLAELDQDELVLDPACGTGRFLIYAMDDMIRKIDGRNRDDKIREIKTTQLFGSDYDLDVAKLAKMNMYIHGDGKTNIMDRDGLTLSDFDGKVDAILTNPPLGSQSYVKTDYDENFKLRRMEVIPKKNVTKEKLEAYSERLELIKKRLDVAKAEQNKKIADKLSALVKKYEEEITKLQTKIRSNESEWVVRGKQMKGGALFLGAAMHYLKPVRDKNALLEWRGGKLLIILDEGILNTDEYREIRQLIKKHFYIKAIVSLSRDTFVPVSSTTTKTSILYAIRKDDLDALQQEPIFFAHVDKVGMDTRKRVCPNHLFNNNGDDILTKFIKFKEQILASYSEKAFKRGKFALNGFKGGTISGETSYYFRYIEDIPDRLDENFNNPRYDIIEELLASAKFEVVSLGQTVENLDKRYLLNITSGKTPENISYKTEEGIPFLGAGCIHDEKVDFDLAPLISREIHETILQSSQIKTKDVLVTMAGTIGHCAVFESDKECNANQAIAILRLNTENVHPKYLMKYLDSSLGQLFFGKLQHIASQPNINLEEILRIKVIMPKHNEQIDILNSLGVIEKEVAQLESQKEQLLVKANEGFTELMGLKRPIPR